MTIQRMAKAVRVLTCPDKSQLVNIDIECAKCEHCEAIIGNVVLCKLFVLNEVE